MNKWMVAGALALVSVNAMAADDAQGFYLGAGFGQSKYDLSQDELDDVALGALLSNGVFVNNANSSLDDSGTAFALSGGYRFSRYLAVEVGYLDLGSAKYRATAPVFVGGIGLVNAAIGLEFSSKGPTMAAIGSLPLGTQFDLHGHAGIFFADTSVDVSVALDQFGDSDEVSGNSQDFFAGVGAAYHLNKQFALSLDFSLFKDVGDGESTGEGDIDALSLNVHYAF